MLVDNRYGILDVFVKNDIDMSRLKGLNNLKETNLTKDWVGI